MPKSDESLTLKQERWINAYLETGNATEAARIAGYRGSDETLRQVGSQNITKYHIKKRIEQRLSEEKVTAAEVVGTLASHLRADVTDLFDDTGVLDLQTIRERGLGHLIKKIKRTRRYEGRGEEREPVDELEIEVNNQQSAANQLCKVLGIEKEPVRDPDVKWQEIAEHLSAQFNVPIEQVRRDLAAQKPELASTLLQ
jgi:hypothetical protein